MKKTQPIFLIVFGLAVSQSLGGTNPSNAGNETNDEEWSLSLSAATYFVRNGRDYVNPSLVANKDWFHLEARYNYEAYKSGSLWIGYNFSAGKKLSFEVTPMIGGVVGDITGVAPGYTISVNYEPFEFFTQGEYFFDSETREGNFFYNWSELSWVPVNWFRVGFVLDRTKALGANFDVRRGPLFGIRYKKMDLTAYWLSPGSTDNTFVLAATMNF